MPFESPWIIQGTPSFWNLVEQPEQPSQELPHEDAAERKKQILDCRYRPVRPTHDRVQTQGSQKGRYYFNVQTMLV